MSKLLLILAVLALAWWLWHRALGTPRGSKPANHENKHATETMIRCAHCGVHLPLADAVVGNNGVYCCAGHRQLGQG